MTVFILSFVVLLLIVTAMSVGVLLGRQPIKGSCGGMSALGMETACDVCGGDKRKCEDEQEKNGKRISTKNNAADAENLAYDAVKDGIHK